MKKIIFLFSPMAAIVSSVLLSGCGELDNPGITTGEDKTIEEITFELKRLNIVRELKTDSGELKLEKFIFQDSLRADFTYTYDTFPVTGMGKNDRVPVQINSILDITNTQFDPNVTDQIKTKENERKLCFYRNSTAEERGVEPEPCTLADNVLACKTADPTADCSDITDPFGVDGLVEPQEVKVENFFEYRLLAARDQFSEIVDITNSDFSVSEVINDKGIPELVSDYRTAPTTIGQNTSIRFKFDLDDTANSWGKVFQVKLGVGDEIAEVVIETLERDGTITAPPVSKFAGPDVLDVVPGEIINTSTFSFSGFNSRAPFQIVKATDFVLEYSINKADYVTLDTEQSPIGSCDDVGVLCLSSADQVDIRIHTLANITREESDPAFDQEYKVTLNVGEPILAAKGSEAATQFQYTTDVVVKTHTYDYVPGVNSKLSFPTVNSLSPGDNMSIRGQFFITQAMKDYVDPDKVELSAGDEFKPISASVYRMVESTESGVMERDANWTPVTINFEAAAELGGNITPTSNPDVFDFSFLDVPLAAGEKSFFEVVATSNLERLTNGVLFSGISRPLPLAIEQKAEVDIDTYPANTTTMLRDPVDAGINPINGLLYITDRTALNANETGGGGNFGLVWKYSLTATNPAECATRPQPIQYGGGGGDILGIAFNHARPDLGGAIIKAGQGNMYLTEAELNAGPNALVQPTKGTFDLQGNAGREGRHLVYDHRGVNLYQPSHNRAPNRYQEPQQAFISMLEVATNGNDVTGLDPYTQSGKVAKEVNGTSTDKRNNNGISIDMITLPGQDGEVDEWILSLDMQNDTFYFNRGGVGFGKSMGGMNIRKFQVSNAPEPTYDPDSSWSDVTLTLDGAPLSLIDGHAVAFDDKRKKAYIVDNFVGKIYEVDASSIATANTLPVTRVLVDNETSDIQFKQIHALVMEGGIDYFIAVDYAASALYAIDPITGDITYLLKALREKTDTDKNVCEQ